MREKLQLCKNKLINLVKNVNDCASRFVTVSHGTASASIP